MIKKTKIRTILDPIFIENQVTTAVLGICSALAVTIRLDIALTMSFAVMFVTSLSCFFVALLKNYTPPSIRMIVQLIIISTLVIFVDEVLKAYAYELSALLSVFVSLIITNCIVMGRCESTARFLDPLTAFLDGLGASIGYSIILIITGAIREIFGFGTLFSIKIIPESFYSIGYSDCNLMALAPSAFFILGILVWCHNIAYSHSKRK